jgi:ribosomal RNA-processing protein 36
MGFKFKEAVKKTKQEKNAPLEISASKRVSRKVHIAALVQKANTGRGRDPRFEQMGNGEFNEVAYRKNYSFLEERREDEIKQLEKDSKKKAMGNNTREMLREKLKLLRSEQKQDVLRGRALAVEQKFKKEENSRVRQGKNRYYMKPGELRKAVMKDKFEYLQGTGKLKKFMDKRRKKNAQKDRKWLTD